MILDYTHISPDAIFTPLIREYVGVVSIYGHYVPMHIKDNHKELVDDTQKTDLKTAILAAESFAKNHGLFFSTTLLTIEEPVITIYQHNHVWFPAEANAKQITLLNNSSRYNFGGNLIEAIYLARQIANIKNFLCIPSIGISLSHKQITTS